MGEDVFSKPLFVPDSVLSDPDLCETRLLEMIPSRP